MFPFNQGLNFMAEAGTWVYENPASAACAVAGTGGVVVVASPVLVTAPILSGLGFNTGGVAAGSYATGIQSSIGNVVSNSPFATGQSAGAGGLGSVAVNTAAQACGALTGMRSAGFAWFRRNGTGQIISG